MMRNFIIILALLALSACSPQKRLTRLLRNHPELLTKDTVFFRDTIKIPSVSYDTIISLSDLKDTVFINNDRLQIKLKQVDHKIYVQGECKGDTIYINRKIPVDKIKYIQDPQSKKTLKRIIAVLFLLLVSLLYTIFKRGR